MRIASLKFILAVSLFTLLAVLLPAQTRALVVGQPDAPRLPA